MFTHCYVVSSVVEEYGWADPKMRAIVADHALKDARMAKGTIEEGVRSRHRYKSERSY